MAFCSNLPHPILLETSKNLNTKSKDLTFSCMLSHQEGENLYLTLWEGFALLKELKDKDKLLTSYMEQREHSGLESKYLNLSYSIKGTKKMVSHIFSLLLTCTHTHTLSLKRSHTSNSHTLDLEGNWGLIWLTYVRNWRNWGLREGRALPQPTKLVISWAVRLSEPWRQGCHLTCFKPLLSDRA